MEKLQNLLEESELTPNLDYFNMTGDALSKSMQFFCFKNLKFVAKEALKTDAFFFTNSVIFYQ